MVTEEKTKIRLVPRLTNEEKQAKIIELITRRDKLVDRLDNGAALIEIKRANKFPIEEIERYEDFWIGLLHEYESVCQELHELGGE